MSVQPAEFQLQRAIIELVGGIEVWDFADRRFACRVPLRQLAEESGLSKSTVQRRTDHAYKVALDYGALPSDWQRIGPGWQKGRPRIIYTGDSPEVAATGKKRGYSGQQII